jgi:hypothetical protein
VGASRVDLRLTQAADSLTATLQLSSGPPVAIEFVPAIPAGATDVRTLVASRPGTTAPVRIDRAPTTVTTTWRGGYVVEPPRRDVPVGDTSRGLRVLDVRTAGTGVAIDLEAPSGTAHELSVFGRRPSSVDGGDVMSWEGREGRVRVTFPAAAAGRSRATITLRAAR